MKLSSLTQAEPRSIRVRTLDGSKDVRGARHEPKGRVVLIVLAAGFPTLGEPEKCVPELYQRLPMVTVDLVCLGLC